ncbi:MAG: hypothetical protein H7839_00800, partial [Magnetococcus sp. YQC-5]
HDASALDSILGVVERAWIEGGMGRATVRFSSREDVAPIFKDVQDGILRNVSVGYTVQKYELTEEAGKVPLWRAVEWTPLELSAVPLGADPGAGFRSQENSTNPCQMIYIRGAATMADIAPPKDEVAFAEPITQARAVEPAPQASQARAVEPAPQAPQALQAPQAPQAPQAFQARAIEPAPQGVTHAEAEIVARDAVAAERKRSSEIYDTQGKLKLERSFADKLVQDGVSIDDARRSLIDEASKRSLVIHNHVATAGGMDERATRNEAVQNALLHRFDPSANKLTDPARQWRGLTLLEMARTFLESNGGSSTRGMSRQDVAIRALETSSDFPNLLAAVAGKTLRQAYEAAPRTFQPFCRQVTAIDFKQMHRVQLGEAPMLEKVNEGGEFKRGAMGEGKESYRVETYGKIINISRQTLVNDDLNAFTRIPQLFGVAAANLESDVVWSIITGNPVMGDGTALFHANHGNLAATGTALSVASLGAGRKFMSVQTGLDGKTILNVRPAFIIVPAAMEVNAEQLLSGVLLPAKTIDVVPQSLRTLQPIAEPRLDAVSTTAWYLMAASGLIDTIEYAYLDGNSGVYIENRVGFDVDGVEIKARLDFGAKAIDWRGMFKNPGV